MAIDGEEYETAAMLRNEVPPCVCLLSMRWLHVCVDEVWWMRRITHAVNHIATHLVNNIGPHMLHAPCGVTLASCTATPYDARILYANALPSPSRHRLDTQHFISRSTFECEYGLRGRGRGRKRCSQSLSELRARAQAAPSELHLSALSSPLELHLSFQTICRSII